MKIVNKEDVQKLDLLVKEELQINLENYNKPEVLTKVLDIIAFPSYALPSILKGVLLFLGLYISGFFLFNLSWISGGIYGILGFVFAIILGVLGGLCVFIGMLKKDLLEVFNLTFTILNSAIEDVSSLTTSIFKEGGLDLLFKGLLFGIVHPTVDNVIADKVPLVGGSVNKVVFKTFKLVANNTDLSSGLKKITKSEEQKMEAQEQVSELENQEIEPKVEKVSLENKAIKLKTKAQKSIVKSQSLVGGMVENSLTLASYPFKLAFGLVFFIKTLFLAAIYFSV